MTLFKKSLAMALVVGTLAVSPTAFAKIPSDASLNQLATLSKFDETFKEGMKVGFLSTFSANVHQVLEHSGTKLSDGERAKLDQAIDDLGNKILKDIATPTLLSAMRQEFVSTGKKHFNQAEVDALIEFYGTPIGQSIVGKQNAMSVELGRASVAFVTKDKQFEAVLKSSLEKHLPAFEQTLKTLLDN